MEVNIRAEITALQRQIEQLDLAGKIKRESQAIAKLDNFNASNGQHILADSIRTEQLLLSSERQNAEAYRAGAEREIASITRDISRLNALLNADDRATQAQKQIDAATEQTNAAQTAVDAALNTHTEIGSLAIAEGQALDRAKGDAAGAVLAQIKSGKPGKLPPVSRERLDALILAQDAARAELLEAQESLAECQSNLAVAQSEHAEAMADGTARTLHMLAREYAQALRNHKAASLACGRNFDEPDVDLLIRQLEHEAESFELDALED